jgi:hypothetical protein
MNAIVPPERKRIEPKPTRDLKSFRYAQWCLILFSTGVAAFAIRLRIGSSLLVWAQLVSLVALTMAGIAAIGTVIYRIVEIFGQRRS